jgi:formate dehydrogenase major subunit
MRERLVSGFSELKDDGTTSCGCWIYSGVFPEPGRNRARERKITSDPIHPEWGFAWPHNRRILYNRASADPEGRPWSERKKLVWWDAGGAGGWARTSRTSTPSCLRTTDRRPAPRGMSADRGR